MPRPKGGYILPDGTAIPGTTTILNRFKDSGGLIYWAWQQGKEGKDFREEKDKAASAGTLAHAMVEAYLREEDPESVITGPPEVAEKARQGFANWLVWKRQSALHIIAWEKPMICVHHRYGGTPDHLVNDDPLSIALMDIKCARGIYVENLLQLAAYGHLFEDAGAAIKGYHLGRFSPEQADFSHHFFADLKDAFEMFLLLRQAYDLDKRLKARV